MAKPYMPKTWLGPFQRRPTEVDLLSLTIARLENLADYLGTSPSTLCKHIVADNRAYGRMLDRRGALTIGKPPIKNSSSLTMYLYERIHAGLDTIEGNLDKKTLLWLERR